MGSEQRIMEATYRVLAENSYADLSMGKIADQLGVQKSALYYHFDNREDLMLSFLDHLQDRMAEEILKDEHDPEVRLKNFLKEALEPCDEEMWGFRKALFEMRSEAPYNSEFSEKFRELDQKMLDYLEKIFDEKGSEKPSFRAEILLSEVEGAVNRSLVLDDREKVRILRKNLMSEYT